MAAERSGIVAACLRLPDRRRKRRAGAAARACSLRPICDALRHHWHNACDADRTRLPPLPLQCAGGAGRAARRGNRAPARRWRLAAPGPGAGAAALDAPLAAAGAGRTPGHLRQPALPDARANSSTSRSTPTSARRRRPIASAPDVLRWHLLRALQQIAAGRARRLPGQRACSIGESAQAVVARRRAGRHLREIPGLAPRLAAGVGAARAGRRLAGGAVAAGRPRTPASRAPHRRLPARLRRARRRRAAGIAAAPVRVRLPERLARRAAGDRQPVARGHPALLPAHAGARVLGRPRALERATTRRRDDDRFLGGGTAPIRCSPPGARPGATSSPRSAAEKSHRGDVRVDALRRAAALRRCSVACRPTCSTTRACSATCCTARRRDAAGRARRSIASMPACSSTPATRACAKCRCCTTSCARCSTRRRRPANRRCSRATSPCSRRTSTSYAPHIEAVFGGAAGSARESALHARRHQPAGERVAGGSIPAPARSCRCARRRSATCSTCSRCRRSPRAFRSTNPQRGLLQDWLQEAGARWGLDAADRARHGVAPATTPTPSSSRSIACCSATPAAPTRTSPASRRGRRSKARRRTRSMRRCAFWHCCATAAHAWRRRRRPRDGSERLNGLLDDAFAVERDSIDAAVLKRLRELDRELRRRRRRRRLRSARRTCRGAGAPARRTRAGRCARAVPVRRHLLRPHGADAADSVPRDLPARAGRGRVPARATAAIRSTASSARSTRASAAPAIRRGATPTATCSCSCSRPPDACCT